MLIVALLGFAFGFIASIPVAGPIAALVVKRGIEGRYRAGAFIAIGGGIAEAAYAFLAFWGFSKYLTQYPLVVPISRALAAVILIGLGFSFTRIKSMKTAPDERPRNEAFGSFMLGFMICLLNPTLIATWGAGVTTIYSMGLVDFSTDQAVPFAVGVCAGIAGWFGLLLLIIRRYRERFSTEMLTRVIRVMGWLLMLLGLWFGVRFVQGMMASD